MNSADQPLDEEWILDLFKDDGPFHAAMPGYEVRQEQLDMLRDTVRSFNEKKVALIEAGTGTGKSLAYLIPAIFFALKTNERVVISTHTIHLQEQLVAKDIPFIKKALGLDFKVVLAKGMGNYVCIRKLKDTLDELVLLDANEAEALQYIESWSEKTTDGTKSDLPFHPSAALWEKIGAESDACSREKCPYYRECHFFKARKEAADAKILIVNHSLLFVDLAYRRETQNGILPDYARLVLDEAHNIEEIACEHLASKASIQGVIRNLSRLHVEGRGKPAGKLSHLLQKIISAYPGGVPESMQALVTKLTVDVNGLRKETLTTLIDAFESFREFAENHAEKGKEKEEELSVKLRLLKSHHEKEAWNTVVSTHSKTFIDTGKRLIATLKGALEDLGHLGSTQLIETTAGLRLDIEAVLVRLEGVLNFLTQFLLPGIPENKVRWIESSDTKNLRDVRLVDAELDLANTLSSKLFNPLSSVLLCSATLTTDGDFKFAKRRLGLCEGFLDGRKLIEKVYLSPFSYENQALLLIPNDLPSPLEEGFLERTSQILLESAIASQGNAFFLFTSFGQMHRSYHLLKDKLYEKRLFPLIQGEFARSELLKRFKNKERSILFGTDSFWEGVDVAGDALRLVVLVKLPFRVPGEPINEARRDEILKKGGDPFFEYALPSAIVKFKQGFGRLIRRKNDRGCILCLDKRIIQKGYGQSFLLSLPPARKVIGSQKEVLDSMKAFYKKTYKYSKMA